MRSLIGLLLALTACGATPKPTNATLYCSDCEAPAYATFTTFHGSSAWETTCSEGTYMVPGDPPGTCHDIPHDTKVLCDGVPCAIRAENGWYEVTARAPGQLRIHARLTPLDGSEPKDVTLGQLVIERPIHIVPRCAVAPRGSDTDTIVVVDLLSHRGATLAGGGAIRLEIVDGEPCEDLANGDPAPEELSELSDTRLERRFRCPATGGFDVRGKGRDFTARASVRCP